MWGWLHPGCQSQVSSQYNYVLYCNILCTVNHLWVIIDTSWLNLHRVLQTSPCLHIASANESVHYSNQSTFRNYCIIHWIDKWNIFLTLDIDVYLLLFSISNQLHWDYIIVYLFCIYLYQFYGLTLTNQLSYRY